MTVSRDYCKIASDNVRAGINSSRRFPQNIFMGSFKELFFFDSDWMTESAFVGHVKAFLEAERGQCACLCKLDLDVAQNVQLLHIHNETSSEEYRALLVGPSPGYGWVDAMERLACASDTGEWCMYCEPNNEIAVIGFRHEGTSPRYLHALSEFRATDISLAIKNEVSFGFSQVASSPEWREAFVREYTTPSR